MHFHGIHSSFHDGFADGRGEVAIGDRTRTSSPPNRSDSISIIAMPSPLKRHIHKGLYGMFIVDPDPSKRGDLANKAPIRATTNPASGRNS